jgi:hypothetical protein
MKKINATIAALFLSTASMTAIAAENKHAINYDYVQAGFVNFEISYGGDSVDIDFVGFGASTSLTDNISLFGGYITDTDDRGDLRISAVGLGYHVPLSDTTDLQMSFAHNKYEASASGLTGSATGSTISVGVATALTDATELSIAYIRPEVDGESVSGYGASLAQDITNELALVGDLTSISESGVTLNATALSLRYNF